MEHFTPQFLKDRIKYDPKTGKLFWLTRGPEHYTEGKVSCEAAANRFNGQFAGKEAFTAESDGYKVGNFSGKMLKAHRVAWAIHHGAWPRSDLDHINGNRLDNRIDNLRESTRQGNSRNVRSAINATSKYLGVYRSNRENKPWAACIKLEGKTVGLGRFKRETDAAAAYNEAAAKHFGEFARLNEI